MNRRDMLRLAACGVGAAYLFRCTDTTGLEGGQVSGPDGEGGACERIPEETAGPFPGDGSIGPGRFWSRPAWYVRTSRSSFAGLSGVAPGVPLTVRLQLLHLQDGCAPAPGLAVYIWHLRPGRALLPVQQGCHRPELPAGRPGERRQRRGVVHDDLSRLLRGAGGPHIHFQVYPSLAAAADEGNKSATSQLAFPEASCNEAYATEGYETSARESARTLAGP